MSLNANIRLRGIITSEDKHILYNTVYYQVPIYCTIVWSFKYLKWIPQYVWKMLRWENSVLFLPPMTLVMQRGDKRTVGGGKGIFETDKGIVTKTFLLLSFLYLAGM